MKPCMRSFPYQRPPLWSVRIPKVMTVHYSWSKTTPLFVQLKLLESGFPEKLCYQINIFKVISAFSNLLKFLCLFSFPLLLFLLFCFQFLSTTSPNLKSKTQRRSKMFDWKQRRSVYQEQISTVLRIWINVSNFASIPPLTPKKSTDNKFGLILR